MPIDGKLFGEAIGVESEVVGRAAPAVVVHGEVGEDTEGFAIEGLD